MKFALVFVILATAAFGQFPMGSGSYSARGGPEGWTVQVDGAPAFGIRTVEGAPYSGVEVIETVQTLANGSTIRRKMPEVKMWRDGAGRMRMERPLVMAPMGQGPKESPVLIEILDPVGRSKYVLEVDKKTAHRMEMPEWKGGAQAARLSTSGMGVGTVVVPAQDGRPELKTEILGTQVMEGITVEGKRQTTTWPVGAMGNDQPLVAVTESWMSVELGLPVMVKSDDPRNGVTTRRMTELRRGEPDAGLFRPPDGWTVVEERGPFTMRIPPAQ